MAKCPYCGCEAGLLRKSHAECEERHNNALSQMRFLAAQAAVLGTDLDLLQRQLTAIASANHVLSQETRSAIIHGWEEAAHRFLDDGVLSPDEETRLHGFRNRFNLTETEIDANGAFSRVARAGALRQLFSGQMPVCPYSVALVPFNLQRSESLVWLFPNVQYYEEKTRRSYVGGSQGVSFRIAKGMYYRVSGFRGHSVETTQMEHLDTGLLGATSKHVYFSGGRKSLRIPYAKIAAFSPYSDGIGICRDAATAKPQVFVTGDGWFAYNLMRYLAQACQ